MRQYHLDVYIYEDGRDDYFDGVERIDNPYELDSDNSESWLAGWVDALCGVDM